MITGITDGQRFVKIMPQRFAKQQVFIFACDARAQLYELLVKKKERIISKACHKAGKQHANDQLCYGERFVFYQQFHSIRSCEYSSSPVLLVMVKCRRRAVVFSSGMISLFMMSP